MNEIERLKAENAALRAALENIIAIPNYPDGGDWDEIIEARSIARAALATEAAHDQD